jgi:hypothetical protein
VRQSVNAPSAKGEALLEDSKSYKGSMSARNLAHFKTIGDEPNNCDDKMQVEEVEDEEEDDCVVELRAKGANRYEDELVTEPMSPLSKKDFEEIREKVSQAENRSRIEGNPHSVAAKSSSIVTDYMSETTLRSVPSYSFNSKNSIVARL